MSLKAFENLNWADLLGIIIFIRVTYMAAIFGVGYELLSILSGFLVLAVSLYFYVPLGQFLADKAHLSVSASRFLVFIGIAAIMILLSCIISRLSQRERPASLAAIERVVSVILGVFRSAIAIGMIFIVFMLLPVKGINDSVSKSMSGLKIVHWDLNIYSKAVNFVNRAIGLKPVDKDKVYQAITGNKDYEIKVFDIDIEKKGRFFRKEF